MNRGGFPGWLGSRPTLGACRVVSTSPARNTVTMNTHAFLTKKKHPRPVGHADAVNGRVHGQLHGIAHIHEPNETECPAEAKIMAG